MANTKNGDGVAKLVHIRIKVLNFSKFYGKVGVTFWFQSFHSGKNTTKQLFFCQNFLTKCVLRSAAKLVNVWVFLFFQAYAKIKVDSGVVLEGQLRIAKRIGIRKIARNLASYAQAKARQKVLSLNYYVLYNIHLLPIS